MTTRYCLKSLRLPRRVMSICRRNVQENSSLLKLSCIYCSCTLVWAPFYPNFLFSILNFFLHFCQLNCHRSHLYILLDINPDDQKQIILFLMNTILFCNIRTIVNVLSWFWKKEILSKANENHSRSYVRQFWELCPNDIMTTHTTFISPTSNDFELRWRGTTIV